MVSTGAHNAETIARRFGYDVRLVRRRLPLRLARHLADQNRPAHLTGRDPAAEQAAATFQWD